jgi:hypothetical protein
MHPPCAQLIIDMYACQARRCDPQWLLAHALEDASSVPTPHRIPSPIIPAPTPNSREKPRRHTSLNTCRQLPLTSHLCFLYASPVAPPPPYRSAFRRHVAHNARNPPARSFPHPHCHHPPSRCTLSCINWMLISPSLTPPRRRPNEVNTHDDGHPNSV